MFDAVLMFLPAADMGRVEMSSASMREAVARAVPAQVTDVYWLEAGAAQQRREGESWASVARRAVPGLDVRLQARAVGDVELRVGDARHNRDCAGVYELQHGGRKLVGGRAVYKLISHRTRVLFHTRLDHWAIGENVGDEVYFWRFYAPSFRRWPTPDQIGDAGTYAWEVWKNDNDANDQVGQYQRYTAAGWVNPSGAKVVRAGAGAAQAARAEVARLEAEARVQAHSVGDVELG